MASNVLRVISRQGLRAACQRSIATTSVAKADAELTLSQKEKYYPKIGDREVVGYGINGSYTYTDREEFPCPSVRFRENTDAILALREKEKGDWKSLSLEDKKALYRASFCQTYTEMKSNNVGEWKTIMAGILLGFSLTGWFMIFLRQFVYPPIPHTITPEWQIDQLERMIAQGQGQIEGVSSKWDYEKNTWK